MDAWLHSVVQRIASGELLPAAYFATLDCDAALDARDGDAEFEAEWMRLFTEIETRWNGAQVSEVQRQAIHDLRRESFMVVSMAAGQHEIAGYVSDDFDLIARGRILNMADDLLDQLWRAYDGGEFPVPPLR